MEASNAPPGRDRYIYTFFQSSIFSLINALMIRISSLDDSALFVSFALRNGTVSVVVDISGCNDEHDDRDANDVVNVFECFARCAVPVVASSECSNFRKKLRNGERARASERIMTKKPCDA